MAVAPHRRFPVALEKECNMCDYFSIPTGKRSVDHQAKAWGNTRGTFPRDRGEKPLLFFVLRVASSLRKALSSPRSVMGLPPAEASQSVRLRGQEIPSLGKNRRFAPYLRAPQRGF